MLLDGERRIVQESEVLDLGGILQIDQDAEPLTFFRGESRFKKTLETERRKGAGGNLLGNRECHGLGGLILVKAINYFLILTEGF